MAEKTISHVQGKGSVAHNNRLFRPKNVDPARTKENVTYACIEIGSAYDFLFSKPVEEYNSKQKRSDRKINVSYYEHLFNRAPCNTVIESANGQKSFYEDVVQIGTKDDTGIGSADAEIAGQCLDEYMKGFQQRNPNFYVFNAVLHMDEATPHLHIDYIPFGHYSRGVSVQNGIAQALAEMGFGKGKDAINRWRQSERKILKDICREHGLDISDEAPGRGYSMKVEEYKEHQDRIHNLENQKKQLENELQPLMDAKIITESVSVSGKKVLLGDKYIVPGQEFEKLNLQKKAVAVQQQINSDISEQLTKEKLRYEQLNEVAVKKGNAIKSKYADTLIYLEQARIDRDKAAGLLYKQQHLNEEHERLLTCYEELFAKVGEMKDTDRRCRKLELQNEEIKQKSEEQNNKLRVKIRDKDEEIAELQEQLSEKDNEIEELNQNNTQLKEEISENRSFINTLREICEYLCRKMQLCYDEILSRRLSGYSLERIFNPRNYDNER